MPSRKSCARAGFGNVVSVGSVSPLGQPSTFSNYGPDLVQMRIFFVPQRDQSRVTRALYDDHIFVVIRLQFGQIKCYFNYPMTAECQLAPFGTNSFRSGRLAPSQGGT